MRHYNLEKHEGIYRFLFYLSVTLKGLHALIEVIGGFALFIVTKSEIRQWITSITGNELLENPQDLIVRYLINWGNNLSLNTQHFMGWYLLLHGVVNVIPMYGLLRRKMWAFPTAVIILSAFIIYQLFRFYYTRSPWLIVFTFIDIFVIYIVSHEYRYLLSHNNK